ncbi:MAG: DUF1727 domain-containing protein [Mogibacterium sp.]|nr:DUF1727 domain-containing protein [Mogibacterium sp.]
MKRIRFLLTLWAAKLAGQISRLLGKGTAHAAGVFGLRLMPDLIRHFRGIDPEKVWFITGTNGKSSSNNAVVTCLRGAGFRVTTNLEGANLITGVATALIRDASLTGKIRSDVCVFETDERFLAQIHRDLPAGNLCVTNIQKDQVQRNGEPDYIYQKIRGVIGPEMTLYVNNEEPRSASLGRFAGRTIRYSVDRHTKSFEKHGRFDVAMPCPCCGGRIRFRYYNVENVGAFECCDCGFRSDPEPDLRVSDVDFERMRFRCGGEEFPMPYEQPFFLYNYALALAVSQQLGVPAEKAAAALAAFRNIGGRVETVRYGAKVIRYIRIKQENPETLQSAFDYVAQDPHPKVLLYGLGQVEDYKPFYTNTFYAFDCDSEGMIRSGLEHVICFSKAVAYDAANRMLYAGLPEDRLTILPEDSSAAILDTLDGLACDNIYLITLLHKFEELAADCGRREEVRHV